MQKSGCVFIQGLENIFKHKLLKIIAREHICNVFTNHRTLYKSFLSILLIDMQFGSQPPLVKVLVYLLPTNQTLAITMGEMQCDDDDGNRDHLLEIDTEDLVTINQLDNLPENLDHGLLWHV